MVMMVMMVKGKEDQTIEEGFYLFESFTVDEAVFSILVLDKRIGPMIQQESDDFGSIS